MVLAEKVLGLLGASRTALLGIFFVLPTPSPGLAPSSLKR